MTDQERAMRAHYDYIHTQAAKSNDAAQEYLRKYPDPAEVMLGDKALQLAVLCFAKAWHTNAGLAVVLCGQSEPRVFETLDEAITYMLADARSCVGMWMA